MILGDAVYQVESDGRAQEIVNWREKEEKTLSGKKFLLNCLV